MRKLNKVVCCQSKLYTEQLELKAANGCHRYCTGR